MFRSCSLTIGAERGGGPGSARAPSNVGGTMCSGTTSTTARGRQQSQSASASSLLGGEVVVAGMISMYVKVNTNYLGFDSASNGNHYFNSSRIFDLSLQAASKANLKIASLRQPDTLQLSHSLIQSLVGRWASASEMAERRSERRRGFGPTDEDRTLGLRISTATRKKNDTCCVGKIPS